MISTAGRWLRFSSHSTRRSVRRTRLSHSSALRFTLQGRSAIGSPARLTTASTCSSSSSSKLATPRTSAPHRAATRSGWRLNTVSRWPAAFQYRHRRRPINPVPPVSRMCMTNSSVCSCTYHQSGRVHDTCIEVSVLRLPTVYSVNAMVPRTCSPQWKGRHFGPRRGEDGTDRSARLEQGYLYRSIRLYKASSLANL
ncbi:hypothetical protein FQZ97_1015670 [compost metagenome]